MRAREKGNVLVKHIYDEDLAQASYLVGVRPKVRQSSLHALRKGFGIFVLAMGAFVLFHELSHLVYCRSGNRSAQAVSLVRQAGFTTVDLSSHATPTT